MGQPSCEHRHAQYVKGPSTWPEDKVLERKVSSNPFGVDEIKAAGSAILIRCMRSTSPRQEVDMCANSWAEIRLLLCLIGRGLLDLALCRGGEETTGGVPVRPVPHQETVRGAERPCMAWASHRQSQRQSDPLEEA